MERRPATSVILLTVLLSIGPESGVGQKQLKYKQVVDKAPTSVSLSCSTGIVEAGGTAQFSASVSPTRPSVPTGSVVFTATGAKSGTTVTSAAIPLDRTGSATWIGNFPSAEAYVVHAAYSGDSNYLASASTPIPVTGTGSPDFRIVAPAVVTIHRGDQWSASIPIESLNGFTGAVLLRCERPAADMSCHLFPYEVKLELTELFGAACPAVVEGSTTVTIRTFPQVIAPVSVAFLLFGIFSRLRKYKVRASTTIAAIFVVLLTGCGGEMHYRHPGGTALGVYNISIFGSSGKMTHTAVIKVTVVK